MQVLSGIRYILLLVPALDQYKDQPSAVFTCQHDVDGLDLKNVMTTILCDHDLDGLDQIDEDDIMKRYDNDPDMTTNLCEQVLDELRKIDKDNDFSNMLTVTGRAVEGVDGRV